MGEQYLAHYGIKFQKWGHRNGPPYPLDPATDYSAAEKKAAVKKYKSAKAAYKVKKSEYKMKKQEIKRLKALKAQMKQGPEAMAGAATDSYGNTYTMKVEKGSRAAKRLAKTSYKLTKAQLKNAKAEKKVIKEEKNKLKKELKDAKAQLDAIKESMRKNGASEEEIKSLTRSTEEKIDSAMDKINHSSHSYSIKFTDDSECLEHYGVKGMKWRHHKVKDPSIQSKQKSRDTFYSLDGKAKDAYTQALENVKKIKNSDTRAKVEQEIEKFEKYAKNVNKSSKLLSGGATNQSKLEKESQKLLNTINSILLSEAQAEKRLNSSEAKINVADKENESSKVKYTIADIKQKAENALFGKPKATDMYYIDSDGNQKPYYGDLSKETRKKQEITNIMLNGRNPNYKSASTKIKFTDSKPRNPNTFPAKQILDAGDKIQSATETAVKKTKETVNNINNAINNTVRKPKKKRLNVMHSDSSYVIKFKN